MSTSDPPQPPAATIADLIDRLDDPDPYVRGRAVDLLVRHFRPIVRRKQRARPTLAKALGEAPRRRRATAPPAPVPPEVIARIPLLQKHLRSPLAAPAPDGERTTTATAARVALRALEA